MDLNEKGESSPKEKISCSICLEEVLHPGARSIAKLQCGHDFHLDCIGSAFNAKGAMQCPNCRKVEKGRWMYGGGGGGPHRTSSTSDLDFDGWITEEFYDLSFHELPIGFHWCPLRGFTQITSSLFEDGDSQPFHYHDLIGNNSMGRGGDHSNASSSSSQPACPYLSQHLMHAPPPPSSSTHHPNADVINPHVLPHADVVNPLHLPGNHGDHQPHAAQFGLRIHRNEPVAQQRLGSFMHPPPPILHGSVSITRSGNSVISTPVVQAPIGEVRGAQHHHGPRATSAAGPVYQQAPRTSPPFVTMRRVRPRNHVAFFSSVAATATATATASSTSASLSSDMGGGSFYGFSLLNGSAGSRNGGSQPRDNTSTETTMGGRHMDRFYAPPPGRDSGHGPAQLPWIPFEGESQWWGPFNPSQHIPQPGGGGMGFAGQRGNHGNNSSNNINGGYQHMPPPPRMPPYM